MTHRRRTRERTQRTRTTASADWKAEYRHQHVDTEIVTDGGEPLWRRDEERWATERRRYLERAAGLDEPVAHAVAWSELGYSDRAVGGKIGRSAGTVSDYLDAVADEYGVLAACACASSDLDVRGPLGDADLGREVTA